MDAFVSMRRLFTANAGIFQRLEAVEMKQLQTDKKIDDAVMDRLGDGSLKPKLGIFFDGQMFDANVLVEQLTSVAKNRIVLIDDYVTAEILQRFTDVRLLRTITVPTVPMSLLPGFDGRLGREYLCCLGYNKLMAAQTAGEQCPLGEALLFFGIFAESSNNDTS